VNTLQEKSVLMRFSAGLPGQHRKDKRTTKQIKSEKSLGDNAGNWVTELWPKDAMAEIKTKLNEARDYHASVTLPFGVKGEEEADKAGGENKAANRKGASAIAGVGILPAVLICEYRDKMQQFVGEIGVLVDKFLENPKRYVDWALAEHNGTFEPKNYPGCWLDASGAVQLNEAEFGRVMSGKFYLTFEPMPVPAASQFTAMITNLLGVDAESVDLRVADASVEAQRELMRRLIEPVRAMAEKLAEAPKEGKEDIVFRDTLVGNICDIVRIAPALNLTGDAQIDEFVKCVEPLTRYTPTVLRDDKATREEAAKKAAELVARMAAYKL